MLIKRKFLTGNDIYLRTLELDDLDGNYISWFDDEAVCVANSHHVFPMQRKELEEYILNSSLCCFRFAIILNDDDRHIGNICLNNIDFINRCAEISIIIGEKDCWGKGYAEQAYKMLISHGFKALNLHRIYMGTYESNEGIKRLAKKLGFLQEGVRRQAAYKAGEYQDVIEFGLLKSECLWL